MKLGELLKFIKTDYIQIYDVDDAGDFQQSMTREQLYGDPILDANVVEVDVPGSVSKNMFEKDTSEDETVFPLKIGYSYSAFDSNEEEQKQESYSPLEQLRNFSEFVSMDPDHVPIDIESLMNFDPSNLTHMNFYVHPEDIDYLKELLDDEAFMEYGENLGLGGLWNYMKHVLNDEPVSSEETGDALKSYKNFVDSGLSSRKDEEDYDDINIDALYEDDE